MSSLDSVLKIIDSELNLQGLALTFTKETKLRGSLPQLDSMAIVSFVSALEEQLGFQFPDALMDGAIFETVGTLVTCVDHLISGDNP
jgi:acyl carrier protein